MRQLKFLAIFLVSSSSSFSVISTYAAINQTTIQPLSGDQIPSVAFEQAYQGMAQAQLLNQEVKQERIKTKTMERALQAQQIAAEKRAAAIKWYDQSLFLYSQNKQAVFLGCLSCSDYSKYSIYNRHGTYGSRNSEHSIYNANSMYGSVNSNYSACNPHASYPPMLVQHGRAIGLLTLNTNLRGAITDPKTIRALKTSVCKK